MQTVGLFVANGGGQVNCRSAAQSIAFLCHASQILSDPALPRRAARYGDAPADVVKWWKWWKWWKWGFEILGLGPGNTLFS
jgi:hypothetical protein